MEQRMSKEKFSIFYGPRGEGDKITPIDSRDLGAALLALGDLLVEANAFLNKDNGAQLRVNITGFKNGCFGIEIETIVSWIKKAQNFLYSKEIQGAIGILGFVGFHPFGAAKGVWQYLRATKGQKPQKMETVTRQGGQAMVKATFPDGSIVEATADVVEFANRDGVRLKASTVLSPLTKEDFSKLEIVSQDGESEDLATREDLPYFAPLPIEMDEDVGTPLTTERVCYIQLKRPDLRGKASWECIEGDNIYLVAIEDEKFLHKIAQGKQVGSKDILQVHLREEQTISKSNTLKTKRIITKVLAYKSKAQLDLPLIPSE